MNPLVRWYFRLRRGRLGPWLVAFRRVGAREGPEQLIKMATGQLPELPAAANGDTCGDKQRLGLSRLSRLGANAASRVLRSACAEWTVNLFCSAKSSDPFHPPADGPRPPLWVCNMCGACAVTVSGWRSRPRRICRAGLCRRSASRLRPRLVGGAARSSATFDVTGGGRRSRLSVECDDDLAVAAALLNVGQRLEGLVKWECRVDDWVEVAGVVEGGQLAQLGAVGLHEQERVAHT